MTTAPLSLLALVAQALPIDPGAGEMTIAETIAVACALVILIVVGIWVRWRSNKRK